MSLQAFPIIGPVLLLLVTLSVAWYLVLFIRERKLVRALTAGLSSKYQQIEGLHIHYQQIGSGPNLVFLHGIGASSYTWRLLPPLLASHFTLTFVDIPGFGLSSKRPERDHGLDEQARLLSVFLSTVGIEKAGLVGSSMGGAIALWMSKLEPKRFEKVAVIAPAVNSALLPFELARLARLMLPTTQFFLNRSFFKATLKRVFTKHDLITDEVIRNYQRPYLEDAKAIQTFVRATKVLSDSRLPTELASIKTQVLILYGARDKLVPKRVMDTLRTLLPHAHYVEHEHAGHHPQEDEPEWLAQELIRFF